MPLLRRSSDQATHQSDKLPSLPSQSLLKLKDPKLPRETIATQSERYIRNEDDCNRWPKEDEQSKRSDEGKTKAIVPSEQKVALKDAAKEHADAKLSPCDDHENGSKQSGKVPSGNLPGKDTSIFPKDTSLREDTKAKGNYTNAVGGEGTLIETLAKDIGIDLLEAKQNEQQQYVADTRNSHNTLSGCGLQVFDAEMKDIKDVKHNADSRKRGVKKDLVSKSCPPMLRATSPKMNVKQSESKERNQRALQRVTLSKTRDSSQTGKSRNRLMGKDESVVPETPFLQNGYGPDSEVSRLTQQMQDMKGVGQVDCQIVDLIAKIEQENAEQKRERLARVTDATQKWCSCLPSSHQERIISLGEKFLRRMDSTLCYLIVVYRMLAKASWTRSMVAVDIKQAALYAISRGWYVKASDFRDYPFTRGEFAVSAATYLDKIPPDAPEDPFRALYIVISHLPFSCAKLFSKGQVSCPYCLESCEVSFPSFTSRVSWTMENWTDLATCLNSAEPNPWMHSFGWHATECNRSDHIPNVIAFESWTLLELHLHQPGDFPTLIDSQKLTSDPSLSIMNGQILGFVCANTRDFDDPNKHYWFVEVAGGALRHVFDSLKGLQPLTQDIAKKLFVTGVLMFFGPKKTSVLRSAELDAAAGVIPRVVRTSKPIQAQGRLRANKVRNFLCRQHGVKKKRFKRGKLGKRLSPAKMQKSERLRDGRVSAVTSLAKIPGSTFKNSNCKKSILSRQRKLTLRKSEKGASSIGQIDKLFQLQLRENSDIQKNDLGQPENIEDISDEDFMEECPDPRLRLAGSVGLDKGICQPDNNDNDNLLDKEGLCGTVGNVTPRDRIGDDPIEDFSDEKQPGSWKPTDHENLMTSPAKHKRNTDRTARKLTSGQVDDAPTQARAEQHAPTEHEQGTTDLILEGLMSGNSKKQKSLLDECRCCSPC